MKYRLLTDEELKHLEGDLKAFLIVNGVEGEEWKRINENEPEKALALVELFSDAVLQTIYEKLEFLEFRSMDSLMVFHMMKTHQRMVVIQRKEGSTVDLSTVEGIHSALQGHATELSFFEKDQTYTKNREATIHEMLEQGCVLSTLEFWDLIQQVIY